MKKITALLTTLALLLSLAACGNKTENNTQNNTQSDTQSNAEAESQTETVTLKGIADLTPHSELIEFVRPKLEEQGIYIDLVSTAADALTNERLASGEIDFNFFQHLPYLEDYNSMNNENLVSAGAIHVEPFGAYSEKYSSLEELPDEITVAVPNDVTNEYRALRILEEQGYIRLTDGLTNAATVLDIEEYLKPVTIEEIDADQIMSMASDFDIYINNTNKVIEADIDPSTYFFRESPDSPYANIVAVRAEDKDNPAIVALVEALKSDETKQFILDNYNGAVIPVE